MPSASLLGKRKRKLASKADAKDPVDTAAVEDAQAIFRRHFEAQFAPLQEDADQKGHKTKAKTCSAAQDDDETGVEDMRSDASDSDDDDEWDGLSSEEGDSQDGSDVDSNESEPDSDAETAQVEVVDHSKPLPSSTAAAKTALMSKREMRAYLSSRPPAASASISAAQRPTRPEEEEDPQNEDSKTLLANDLALQRLISESHILSASNSSSSSSSSATKLFAEGRTRALTTDLRLQKLGAGGSSKSHMPMGMRKGIDAARAARDDRRRREARENGIVLERQTEDKRKRRKKKKDGVAVDMPGMGRFRGGVLQLSKREVAAVEREGMGMDRGGKRRRRRR